MAKRKFDVLVLGATGFTGKWVAKHLYEHYQTDDSLVWGLAGRNEEKLAQVREFIGDTDSEVESVIADSNDEASLRAMVKQTKVVITTVGPYAYYGSMLVKLCAEAGTHYVDLTGEVPWMREMIDAHHVTAEQSGAKIVHSCGFDSIPSDMGVYYTQQQAKAKFGSYLKNIRFSLTKAKGGISGGTFASMINIIKQAVKDKRVRKILFNPYSLNPDPSFKGPDKPDQQAVAYSKELGKWTAPFMMAGINTRIVRRSNALMGFEYGKDFSYTETMPTGAGASGYLAAKTISSAVKSIAFMSITAVGRSVLGLLLPSQGEGPKVDPENPGFYVIHFHGETANGDKLVTKLTGDADPGYGSTSKMLAEAGVCLALDDLGVEGGFWTPSSALGQAILTRLETSAGLAFSVVEP